MLYSSIDSHMFDLLSLLPLLPLSVLAFFYGLIIGSFLNVYIYRFHTGKSLRGHSHCLSCATSLRWFELFPLVSYLALRGRCRTCGCAIPVRYLFVELMTGALFAGVLGVTTSLIEVLFWWVVMSILVVIIVYDIRHYIIPDRLTLMLVLLGGCLLGYRYYSGASLTDLSIEVASSLAGAGFFFLLWLVSGGRWLGFGDVKLAFPLGIFAGATLVFSMIVFSFWIGAIVSVALVGLARLQGGKVRLRFLPRKLTIKSVVPFAPFMIAGCLLVFFTHTNVLDLFTF